MSMTENVTQSRKHWGGKFVEVLKQVFRPTWGKAGMLFVFYCGVILWNILSASLLQERHGWIALFIVEFPLILALWLIAGEM